MMSRRVVDSEDQLTVDFDWKRGANSLIELVISIMI